VTGRDNWRTYNKLMLEDFMRAAREGGVDALFSVM
jgi:hypothetical protein